MRNQYRWSIVYSGYGGMKEKECSTVEEARWAPTFREVYVQTIRQLRTSHETVRVWGETKAGNTCVEEYAVHTWPAILAAWSFGPLYYSYKEQVL